jgi:hypothetical protein
MINKARRSLLRGASFWRLHKKVIRSMITCSKQEIISKILIFEIASIIRQLETYKHLGVSTKRGLFFGV